MPFKPGQSGNPRGRESGSSNKTTVAAKQAFQLAFDGLGGVTALQEWAKDNQTEFFKLFSKLIPQDVNATLRSHEDALKDLK